MLLDAFSTFDAHHPARRPGQRLYVVAPPGDPDALGREARRFPRLVGGLLPVMALPEPTYHAALGQSWWRGLLLTPDARGTPLAGAEVLARLAMAPERPLVVDCGRPGFSRPEHLEALLGALPPRPVILTHGGQLNISGQHLSAARELFLTLPHTLVETSGIYRQDFLEDLLATLGPTRILYGSGHPAMDEDFEPERVLSLPATPQERALMLGGNAARVFGLSLPDVGAALEPPRSL